MRRHMAILLALTIASAAQGEDFGPRFQDGYEKLRNGDPDAALASFQNLLTETPDSELVRYSIASAEYAIGLKKFAAEDSQGANESLQRARTQFDELRLAQTPFVSEHAALGAANAMAQIGKHLDDQQAYNDRKDALQAAVQEYDSLLQQHPENAAAQTNLLHTSYLLKKLLQNPPPDQQQSEDDSGEGENQQQSPQGEQGQEPQDSEPQDEQDPQDDQESDSSSDTPQDQAREGEETADQNIQAILDSLEDKNQEEQKNLRRAKEPPRVANGKWW